jgi:hypothetical protein
MWFYVFIERLPRAEASFLPPVEERVLIAEAP